MGVAERESMKRNASKSITESEAAKIMGCAVKALRGRMVALGYVETCSRCLGSGRYSFNQIDGDRCYGCNGKGRTMMALTFERVTEAKARQDAGELESYFVANRARAAAKASIEPLEREARALYEPIGNQYEAAYQARSITPALKAAQDMNNAFYWGLSGMGTRPNGLAQMGAREILSEVKRGRDVDYERAALEMSERVESLRTLLGVWMARPSQDG